MLRVAICDDEGWAIDQIEDMLEEGDYGEKFNISSFLCGEDILRAVEDTCFDIILLDIEMEQMNGIEVGRKIREKNLGKNTVIIYVTSHREMAADTFDASPFHFVQKPIDAYNFSNVMNKALRAIYQSTSYFMYQKGRGETYWLPLGGIVSLSSDARKIVIKGEEVIDTFFGKLDEVEKQLTEIHADCFVRAHRCTIVNLNHVKVFKRGVLVMEGEGEMVTVSKRYGKNVMERILQYQRQR